MRLAAGPIVLNNNTHKRSILSNNDNDDHDHHDDNDKNN